MTRHRSAEALSPRTLPAGSRMIEAWGIPLLFLIVLVGSYWPVLARLYSDWQSDENYSFGQFVPLAALYLLWGDRKRLARCEVGPCWWGVVVILAAQAARLYGLVFLFESAERYSLVLTIIGFVLLVGGRQVFRQVFWLLLFLFLMIPLPGRIHNMISGPLQSFATFLAVASLEVLGVTVAREGHTMVLNDRVPLAVAEACSGLRMLTAFVAVSFGLAYMVDRPRWQKATLVVSSIPVAILCNQIRLVVTALLFLVVSSKVGERFFHDFAGLTLMPMALLMLGLELWIMAKLVIKDEHGPGKTRV